MEISRSAQATGNRAKKKTRVPAGALESRSHIGQAWRTPSFPPPLPGRQLIGHTSPVTRVTG